MLPFSSGEKNFLHIQKMNRKKIAGCMKSLKRSDRHVQTIFITDDSGYCVWWRDLGLPIVISIGVFFRDQAVFFTLITLKGKGLMCCKRGTFRSSRVELLMS